MNVFVLQFAGELRKMFARKRTYIGFGAFLVVEAALISLLRMDRVERAISRIIEQAGYVAADYLSGVTIGLMTLLWTTLLLGALYLALVAGDVVSKEVEDGTMRMMLCRPISRGRLLLQKVLACAVYTIALTTFIALSALAAGLLQNGVGGLFLYAPLEKIFVLHDFTSGLQRYFLCIPLLAISLFTVTAVAFFFSCMNTKPAAATILTLSILFMDSILKNIPFFESLRPFFLTARMTVWIKVFETRIPWEAMAEDFAWLFAFDATLFVIAWAVFERRDFKT